jgi:hypothetical protein
MFWASLDGGAQMSADERPFPPRTRGNRRDRLENRLALQTPQERRAAARPSRMGSNRVRAKERTLLSCSRRASSGPTLGS